MKTATSRPLPHALFAAVIAAAWTLGGFAATATPAFAASTGYNAALATPLDAPRREIVNGVLWRCEGASCTAADDGSRPQMVCKRVVKAFGSVSNFRGPRGEFSADDLARCNAG